MSSKTQNNFPSYGEALSKVLEKTRYSQRELAKEINVNESQVSRWVNGDATPYVKTQRKITSALLFEIKEQGDVYTINPVSHSQSNPDLGNEVRENIIRYLDQKKKGVNKDSRDPVLLALRDQLKSNQAMLEAQMSNIDSMLKIIDTIIKN